MQQLIEMIRSRCEEVGDCWEWQGYTHVVSGMPVMSYQGRNNRVRRVLAMGLGMNCCGKVVTNTCRNMLCVNPEHLQLMLRQSFNRRNAKEHAGLYINPAHRAKKAKIMRARSRLTPEIVEAIRNDPRPQRVIAEAYGTTQPTVSHIKRGHTWRDYTNPFIQLIK
jgi:predicted XRE-type DNA-binding protein